MPLDNAAFAQWDGKFTFVYDAKANPVAIEHPTGWTYQRVPATADPHFIAESLHKDDGWHIGAGWRRFKGWLQHTRRIRLEKGQRYVFKLEATPEADIENPAQYQPHILKLFWTFNDGQHIIYSNVLASESKKRKGVLAVVEAQETGFYSVGVGIECVEPVLRNGKATFHEVTFQAVPADYGGPSVTRLLPLEADPTAPPVPTAVPGELGELVRQYLAGHQEEIKAEQLLFASHAMLAEAHLQLAKAHDKRAQALQTQAAILQEAADWLDATTQEGIAAALAIRAQKDIAAFLTTLHTGKPHNPN